MENFHNLRRNIDIASESFFCDLSEYQNLKPSELLQMHTYFVFIPNSSWNEEIILKCKQFQHSDGFHGSSYRKEFFSLKKIIPTTNSFLLPHP